MSEHAAAVQTYIQELVKCLEELKDKRHTLEDVICKEELYKLVLLKNIKSLQDKLNVINGNLKVHKQFRDSYDKAIKDTEMGFKKISESSQTLLNLAQHEANKLDTDFEENNKLDGCNKIENIIGTKECQNSF